MTGKCFAVVVLYGHTDCEFGAGVDRGGALCHSGLGYVYSHRHYKALTHQRRSQQHLLILPLLTYLLTLPDDLNERQVHVTDRPTDKYRKNDAFLWGKFIPRYEYGPGPVWCKWMDLYFSQRYDFYIFVLSDLDLWPQICSPYIVTCVRCYVSSKYEASTCQVPAISWMLSKKSRARNRQTDGHGATLYYGLLKCRIKVCGQSKVGNL